MSLAGKLVNYIKASRAELRKVQWPTKQETRNHTVVVILVSLGVAAFLGIIDFGLNLILENIIF